MKKQWTRREALENCIVKGLLVAGTPMPANRLLAAWQKSESAVPKSTPQDILGPFYKKGAPNQSMLRISGDPGVPLRITGKVLNVRGERIPGAQINVWHADHKGLYDLEGYRYRTRLLIEEQSAYEIETILPGHYDDRPAQHVHYLVTAPGHKSLITQAYFATDPFFEGDPEKNYRKRNMASNRELVRPVTLFEGPGAVRTAITFDIILEKA